METRSNFARAIARLDLSHLQRAIALLWYYRHTQQYEERSAAELANDLHDEKFPKPRVSRLNDELKRCRQTVRGKRSKTFQIDVRSLADLDDAYLPLVGAKQVEVSDAVLPTDAVTGTRRYLEHLHRQINGAYDSGFYDACAVLCRRLMESLIIEIYIAANRHHEIQHNGMFLSLDRLLAFIKGDGAVVLGRNSGATMDEIKRLGDTAAHDRTYLTTQVDMNDVKAKYRRLISELLQLAKITK